MFVLLRKKLPDTTRVESGTTMKKLLYKSVFSFNKILSTILIVSF